MQNLASCLKYLCTNLKSPFSPLLFVQITNTFNTTCSKLQNINYAEEEP